MSVLRQGDQYSSARKSVKKNTWHNSLAAHRFVVFTIQMTSKFLPLTIVDLAQLAVVPSARRKMWPQAKDRGMSVGVTSLGKKEGDG